MAQYDSSLFLASTVLRVLAVIDTESSSLTVKILGNTTWPNLFTFELTPIVRTLQNFSIIEKSCYDLDYKSILPASQINSRPLSQFNCVAKCKMCHRLY